MSFPKWNHSLMLSFFLIIKLILCFYWFFITFFIYTIILSCSLQRSGIFPVRICCVKNFFGIQPFMIIFLIFGLKLLNCRIPRRYRGEILFSSRLLSPKQQDANKAEEDSIACVNLFLDQIFSTLVSRKLVSQKYSQFRWNRQEQNMSRKFEMFWQENNDLRLMIFAIACNSV